MPLNFFGCNSRRTSEQETASPVLLEKDDPDRIRVLDIVESYLAPINLWYHPTVFRTLQAEGQEEFTLELCREINFYIPAKKLYVKFKKDSHGRNVVLMSMPKPSYCLLELRAPDQLYNWPTYMGPNYRWGPITIKLEDSVEGRWLSMVMHVTFSNEYVDVRMRQSIMEQGENVTLTGPRPNGWLALGCEHLWTL